MPRRLAWRLAPAQPILGALDDELEQRVGGIGIAGQEVVEMILERGLDQTRDADRAYPALSIQLPPRVTRLEPELAPTGSVTALAL